MFLYRVLAASALLAYSPFALIRALAGRRRMGDLRGRFGRADYPDLAGGIWVHAVSVGEVGVAATLLRALEVKAPDVALGLSVTTAAGREVADRLAGGRIPVFAFPFDLAGPVEKALDRVRPGLVLLTESELWPLFLDEASRRGVRVAVVNGRMSDRSFQRYRVLGRWFATTFQKISLFVMQSADDARRLSELGVPREKIRVEGNVKYDREPAPPFPDAERLRSAAAGRAVLVAASVAEGEEDAVLDAWSRLAPRPLLAIAPRRPERFDPVARKVSGRGWKLVRRSTPLAAGARGDDVADVYLLDTIGELASLYALASLAFIGGSLARIGGHNPIEAWVAGVPVVVGPHTQNFREVFATGERLGIARRAADGTELADVLAAELQDRASLERRGAAARELVAGNRGAAEATASAVLALLPRCGGSCSPLPGAAERVAR